MSEAPASRALPRHVEGRKLATNGSTIGGTLPISGLARLQTALASPKGVVDAQVTFALGDGGFTEITGVLVTQVQLQCQRCLAPVTKPLNVEIHVVCVANDDQASALPKTVESVVSADGQIDLHELIEDELLLALPMVPYHEDFCIDENLYSSGAEEPEPEDKKNPFSVLAQLKGSPKN